MKKIFRASNLRSLFSVLLTLTMLIGMLVLGSVQGQATLSRTPGALPDTVFVVPESVYLRGRLAGDPTYIDWYVNSDAAGAPVVPTTTPQTPNTLEGAAVYATVPGATNLSLTLEVGGTSHDFTDIADETSGDDWTGQDLNATDLEFIAGEQNSAKLMKWTLTAKVDPLLYGVDTFTYVNYSVVYSPMYVPSAYILDAGNGRGNMQSVTTLNGLHINFGGSQKLYEDPTSPDKNKLLDLADAFNKDYVMQGTANDRPQNAEQFRIANTPGSVSLGRRILTTNTNVQHIFGNAELINEVGGSTAVRLGAGTSSKGEIHIDTSRYSQYGQVPNLYVANMRIYSRAVYVPVLSSPPNEAILLVFASSPTAHNSAGTEISTRSTTTSGSGTFWTSGLGTHPINGDNLFLGVRDGANFGGALGSNFVQILKPFDVIVNRTDKGLLRSAIFESVGALPNEFRGDIDAYDTALYEACEMAGSPFIDADNGLSTTPGDSDIANALLDLKDDRIPYITGEAAINHINIATGAAVTTETLVYNLGDDLVAARLDAPVLEGEIGTPGEADFATVSDDAEFGPGFYKYLNHVFDGKTSAAISSTVKSALAANYSWDFYYKPIFTLKYDANLGTGDIDDDEDIVYNGAFTLANPNDFKRSGYTAAGWHTAPDSAPEDAIKTVAELNDLVGGINGGNTFVLYAIWKPPASYITFVTGVTGIPNPERKASIIGEEYGPLPILDRPGHTFLGWFTADDTEITETSIMSAGNQTLYARWSDTQTGTVTFNPNGGSKPSPVSKAFTFGTQYGALPPVVRAGYDFGGWYTDDGKKITAASIVSSLENHTLSARWTAQTAAAAFDSRGGTPAGAIMVTFGEPYGALPTAAREGFSFNGWFTMPVNGIQITAESIVTAAGGHTLFAQWTAVTDPGDLLPPVLVDGDTIKIRYRSRLSIFPDVIRGQNLIWSSNSDLVTVDQDGNIESMRKRFLKSSAATITASNGAGSVSITVVVQPTIWQTFVTFLLFGWLWF